MGPVTNAEDGDEEEEVDQGRPEEFCVPQYTWDNQRYFKNFGVV